MGGRHPPLDRSDIGHSRDGDPRPDPTVPLPVLKEGFHRLVQDRNHDSPPSRPTSVTKQ